MSVDLSKEIWDELKRYVNAVDREEAAEAMVNVLIDNDIGADEIKSTFKSDGDVKRALSQYIRDHEEESDEDDDDYDDYDPDEEDEDY